MALHLVDLSLLVQPEDVYLIPPPRQCLHNFLQPCTVYLSASRCLLAISKSLVEMQAPGPPCCLWQGPWDHASKEGKYKKCKPLGLPISAWGLRQGEGGTNLLYRIPPFGLRTSSPQLAGPFEGEGDFTLASLLECLPFTLRVPQEGGSMLSVSLGDRPRIPAGLLTASPLSRISSILHL